MHVGIDKRVSIGKYYSLSASILLVFFRAKNQLFEREILNYLAKFYPDEGRCSARMFG
jgi:hypothetical protein